MLPLARRDLSAHHNAQFSLSRLTRERKLAGERSSIAGVRILDIVFPNPVSAQLSKSLDEDWRANYNTNQRHTCLCRLTRMAPPSAAHDLASRKTTPSSKPQTRNHLSLRLVQNIGQAKVGGPNCKSPIKDTHFSAFGNEEGSITPNAPGVSCEPSCNNQLTN